MTSVLCWCVLTALLLGVQAERWNWPDDPKNVRLNAKVQFTDLAKSPVASESRFQETQADDVPFSEPINTEGFYNRPPGEGRYPVRVENTRPRADHQHSGGIRQRLYGDNDGGAGLSAPDGTLDTLQYCKCVSKHDCAVKVNSGACGPNLSLCCIKVPRETKHPNTEFTNEVSDNRQQILYPGQPNAVNPFTSGFGINGAFGNGYNDHVHIQQAAPGQTQNIPTQNVLVGIGGPTGIIGPDRPILVGPKGPTGIIGPSNKNREKNSIFESEDLGSNESAQRGILIGPSGPTGIIGPNYNTRPVLVGPGGPTGIIGPYGQGMFVGSGIPSGRVYRGGILVGTSRSTGLMGPGRPVLVGPGGPTGRIGPPLSYGK